jgi:beta-glucosidase
MKKIVRVLVCPAAAILTLGACIAHAPADARAKQTLAAMTQDEKLSLLLGYFSTDNADMHHHAPAEGRPYSAGFVPGISRLGIPPQWQTDAGIGVATQVSPKPRERTALPSGIATASTWNPELAYQGGAMIGNEARLSGFNVMLAGGVNLLREPRNGRNFEYAGEDPVLAGTMVGNFVRGIQSNRIISTIKHFALNDQETGRGEVDVRISSDNAKSSDLLAFEIALEIGKPGAVMCSYNRVNGAYGCESDWLLDGVLKKDWRYPGYVLSDWGAVHSGSAVANAGLDQESGFPFDGTPYFGAGLRDAVAAGSVSQSRLDDMVFRVLRQMYDKGLIDEPVRADRSSSIDLAAHAKVTQAAAEEGIVLLKNEGGILPLGSAVKSVAIIGGHADVGVLSGGGSSQVYPVGGSAVPNEGPASFPGPIVYYPSSPMKSLAAKLPARVAYADGKDAGAAAQLAARSDVAVVFATQWAAESFDQPGLNLPDGQDDLIAAVARANPKTIVVLETGGPVLMPWLSSVSAVVEAWYPGTRGGEAIARVLAGEVNPSGHLPATFPASVAQLPRPTIDKVSVNYDVEGANVGYKWYALQGFKPLFPFGHGLSYTRFEYSNVRQSRDRDGDSVSFDVKNVGTREGKALPQIYVESPKRLAGWTKVSLAPGQSAHVAVRVSPYALRGIESGKYRLILSESAEQPVAATR